jgi:hypothetical protein
MKHYIQVDLILSPTERYSAGDVVDLSEHPELESFLERGLASERPPHRRRTRNDKTADEE